MRGYRIARLSQPGRASFATGARGGPPSRPAPNHHYFLECCDAHATSEVGQKHRISALLGPPVCRNCLQYLPNFVRRSEASHVPDSYVERQKGLGWVELAGSPARPRPAPGCDCSDLQRLCFQELGLSAPKPLMRPRALPPNRRKATAPMGRRWHKWRGRDPAAAHARRQDHDRGRASCGALNRALPLALAHGFPCAELACSFGFRCFSLAL